MSGRRRIVAAGLAALAMASPLAGSAGDGGGFCLQLADRARREIVWRLPLPETARVRLTYEHSLYRVPQEEMYVIGDGVLRLSEIRLGSYDALAYYEPDPLPGRISRHGEEWRLAAPPESAVSPAPFRVGYTTGHRIIAGDVSVDVASLVPPGEVAELSISRDLEGCRP